MAEIEKEIPVEQKEEVKPTQEEVEKQEEEEQKEEVTKNEEANDETEKKKKKKKRSKKKPVTGTSILYIVLFIGSIKPEQRCLGGFVDWYVKSGQTADLQTPVRISTSFLYSLILFLAIIILEVILNCMLRQITVNELLSNFLYFDFIKLVKKQEHVIYYMKIN